LEEEVDAPEEKEERGLEEEMDAPEEKEEEVRKKKCMQLRRKERGGL
jgi:hypothetical protein